MRGRRELLALALVLLLVTAVAGCRAGARQPAFDGEFEAVVLSQAPADLQAHFERMKAVPGLTVLQRGDQTYLMLLAGRVDEPGMRVEVLDVQKPEKGSKEVRLLAILRPGGQDDYPHAVLVLEGAQGLTFKARLATTGEQVLELSGVPLVDR